MTQILLAPHKYIQGFGEIKNLGQHAAHLGKSFYVMVSSSGLGRVKEAVDASFAHTAATVHYDIFQGECSSNEINRNIEIMKKNACDAVIGIGGGKILDAAKAVAHYTDTPVVIVPTIASSDAPCSGLAILYTDEGVHEKGVKLKNNPDIVLLDTEIIVKSPVRLTVAGMGDALATYFEARAVMNSASPSLAGGFSTNAAYALAKLCYQTLLADGVKAKIALEAGALTKAVENIIEANTLLSGIGFESCGLAAAHAIHNGLTEIAATHAYYHGEKVAFGVIVQLVLENASVKELSEVIEFCISVGLPITLADVGITSLDADVLMRIAQRAVKEKTMACMPEPVSAENVYSALLAANAFGQKYKNARGQN